MKTFLPIILLLAITGKQAMSQTMQPCVINTSGGCYQAGNDCYEWSIGELVLVNEMTAYDGKFIVTNGFLQPFAKNEQVVNTPAALRDHEIRILRNPVKDVLGVQFFTHETGKLALSIYDERGYIKYYRVLNVSAGGVTESVNMINYANGNYMLKAEFVSTSQTNLKTRSYKIVKIH